MTDINHKFAIKAPIERVFWGFTSPQGLNIWWPKNSSGAPILDTEYVLDFGPGYIWKAKVTRIVENEEFELTMTFADKDWLDTKVGCRLEHAEGWRQIHFYHAEWPENNNHYYTSNYCWAMYLRVLKRNLEFGEEVPYEKRLEV